MQEIEEVPETASPALDVTPAPEGDVTGASGSETSVDPVEAFEQIAANEIPAVSGVEAFEQIAASAASDPFAQISGDEVPAAGDPFAQIAADQFAAAEIDPFAEVAANQAAPVPAEEVPVAAEEVPVAAEPAVVEAPVGLTIPVFEGGLFT